MLEKFVKRLSSMQIPMRYRAFPKGSKTPLPFLVYYAEQEIYLRADNRVISETIEVTVELYTKLKNLELENKLKRILIDNDYYFEHTGESYLEEDEVTVTYYTVYLKNIEEEF